MASKDNRTSKLKSKLTFVQKMHRFVFCTSAGNVDITGGTNNYTNWTLEISNSFEEDDCLIFNTGVILVIFR